jgi:hypothetical protein
MSRTVWLIGMLAVSLVGTVSCGSDDTSGAGPAGTTGGAGGSTAGTGGSGGSTGGAAGTSGSGGIGGSSPHADAAVDAPADVGADATPVAPCATPIWTVEHYCSGSALTTSATVLSSGALELTSTGVSQSCTSQDVPGDIAVQQTGLEGDFTVDVDFEGFTGAEANLPSRFQVLVGNGPFGSAASFVSFAGGASMIIQTQDSGGQGMSSSKLTMENAATVSISRVGEALSVAFKFGTVPTLEASGYVPTGPLDLTLALGGPSDAAAAQTTTSVLVTDVRVTGGATGPKADSFDCDSLAP